jgi:hypothetical protein
MRKIIIDSKQFERLVKVLREQDEEYYKISPQDYLDLLKYASYNPKVTGIKKFGGKPLYITGDLDVSRLPIDSLGNVIYIDGYLNISSTKISSLKGIEVKGSVNDWRTPIEAKRIRQEELKKLAEADERREDNDWDLNNPNIDEEGLAANALFNHLVGERKLDKMDNRTKELLKTKIEQLEPLKIRYEDADGTLEIEEVSPLFDEISDLEDEIEKIQEKYGDVYYIIPTNYKPYGTLYSFEVIGFRDEEYMVGTYDDMYDAAVESQEQLLDDIGLESLPQNLLMNNLDKESIREYVEEFYESDIRDYPKGYFSQDDYELTNEQEERKEELENYINQMEDLKTEKEEEQLNLEDSYSDEYYQLQKEIDEINENIEKAQDEFDSIEPDDEPTEEMIEEKVSEYVKRAMKNPVNWIKSMDMEDSIKYYVNKKGVAKDIVDSDGIGVISSYDGSYDDVFISGPDGTRYNFVVVRAN